MKDLEKKLLIIHLLDGLLVKIEKGDGSKPISINDEMYFEALHILYQHDWKKGMEYSKKYNIVINKTEGL